MKKKIFTAIITLSALFVTMGVAQQPSANGLVTSANTTISARSAETRKNSGCINLKIKNIKTDKGMIYLAFYKVPSTFLKKGAESFSLPLTPGAKEVQSTEICDLEPGIYAMAVMQDLDSSGDMKFNILGMPREPYGFSNEVHPYFRAPHFKECSFYVEPGEVKTVSVNLINP